MRPDLLIGGLHFSQPSSSEFGPIEVGNFNRIRKVFHQHVTVRSASSEERATRAEAREVKPLSRLLLHSPWKPITT
jgi:hypothetical protein